MAGQILVTHQFVKGEFSLIYQVPAGAGVSNMKIVVNNYEGNGKEDTIHIRTVGGPGRQLVGGVLQWVGSGTPVTDDEKQQRLLYVGTLKNYERYIEENLLLGDLDQIRVSSESGRCNLIAYGDYDGAAVFVEDIRTLIKNQQPITEDQRRDLMLLTGGAYVIQTNNNNQICGA